MDCAGRIIGKHSEDHDLFDALRDFLRLETTGGMLLVATAMIALGVANSPLDYYYDLLIDVPVEVRVGAFSIAKPLLLWINDGLMAIFFLLVGLELKREVVEGGLSDLRTAAFPAIGAVGGMVVPALVYIAFNLDDPDLQRGWAIPAATDIAFALAVLGLLGSRVPIALKVFLTSLAIFDDIGAIVVIALFYTSKLSLLSFAVAAACLPVLWLLNRRGVMERAPYLLVGVIMWAAVLKSGVHATLAGAVLAMFIPIRDRAVERSPLHELEHDLHSVVAFVILPAFAFANAGVTLGGFDPAVLLHPVPLGIAAGLFIGKQLGVFAFCLIGVRLGVARLPDEVTWLQVYGVALLCGIGFTMSLFIGSLAFEDGGGPGRLFDDRVGIIAGSMLSAVAGYFVLRRALR
jgi:NhaA family Na+:H+ antiporter